MDAEMLWLTAAPPATLLNVYEPVASTTPTVDGLMFNALRQSAGFGIITVPSEAMLNTTVVVPLMVLVMRSTLLYVESWNSAPFAVRH